MVYLTQRHKQLIVSALRRTMTLNNHTQSDVARCCSIDQGRVSKILSGNFASLNTAVVRICNYSRISTKDLSQNAQGNFQIGEVANKLIELWGLDRSEHKTILALLEAVHKIAILQKN